MKISRKTQKMICELVGLIIEILKLIKKGIPEKDAVQMSAKKFNISSDKAYKLWKKHKKFSFIT